MIKIRRIVPVNAEIKKKVTLNVNIVGNFLVNTSWFESLSVSGRIRLDQTDLSERDPTQWRSKT